MNRREVLCGGLLAGGGLAALALRPTGPDASFRPPDLAAIVPRTIGAWGATSAYDAILPPADALSQSIFNAYLVRGYAATGWPPLVMVIAFGAVQSYNLQLHQPDACYPASGFTLSGRRAIKLASTPATFVSASNDVVDESLVYWMRTGQEFPRTIWDQRLAIARAALSAKTVDGVLVRLSVRNTPQNRAVAAITDFAEQLKLAIKPRDQSLLYGNAVTETGMDG